MRPAPLTEDYSQIDSNIEQARQSITHFMIGAGKKTTSRLTLDPVPRKLL
jgi:hypothetical protein